MKDHLGNARVTFTTKNDVDTDTATMEAANQTAERSQFLRYDNQRVVNHVLFDHTNDAAGTTGNAIRLSGSANEKTGLEKTLSVIPGDVIDMEAYAKYIDSNHANLTTALNTLITQIANGTAPAGTVTDGSAYSTNSSNPFSFTGLNGTGSSTDTGPEAYLNYLVFDRDYNFITAQSGYKRLSDVPKEDGQNVAHEKLSASITIAQAGYVYIYLSNEETTNPAEVYFDDMKVTQTKSSVIQTQDYYPFGLASQSYSRENSVPNSYLYNGKEIQDELGLGWLDYGPREYMSDIGRFNRPDIFSQMSTSSSTYSYAENDPVSANDMGGNFKFPAAFRQKYPRVTAYLERVLPQLQNNAAIVNSLNKHTNLSKSSIQSDFQNGKGPEVIARDFQAPHWGNNYVVGTIEVNAEDLLQQLENGLGTNDPKYEEFTDVYKLMTIVTIIHEYVHEASKRTKYKLPRGLGGRDEGSNWEHEAFGRFIDYPTQQMAVDFDKHPDKAIHNTAQSLRIDAPLIFYQTTTGSSSGNKNKKQPDADKEASKRSGGG